MRWTVIISFEAEMWMVEDSHPWKSLEVRQLRDEKLIFLQHLTCKCVQASDTSDVCYRHRWNVITFSRCVFRYAMMACHAVSASIKPCLWIERRQRDVDSCSKIPSEWKPVLALVRLCSTGSALGSDSKGANNKHLRLKLSWQQLAEEWLSWHGEGHIPWHPIHTHWGANAHILTCNLTYVGHFCTL